MVLLDAVPGARLGSAFGAIRAASAYTTTNSRIRSIPSSVRKYAGSNRRTRFGALGVTVSLATVLSVIGDNMITGLGDPDPPLSTTGSDTASNNNIAQLDMDGKHVLTPLSVMITSMGDFDQGDPPQRPSFSGEGDSSGGGQSDGRTLSGFYEGDSIPSGGSDDSSGGGSSPPNTLGNPSDGNDSSGSSFYAAELVAEVIGGSPPPPPPPAYTVSGTDDHSNDGNNHLLLCSLGAVALALVVHLASKQLSKRRKSIAGRKDLAVKHGLQVDLNDTPGAPIISLTELLAAPIPLGTNVSGITIVQVVSSDDDQVDSPLDRLISSTVSPICDAAWSPSSVNFDVPICGWDLEEHSLRDNSYTEVYLNLSPEKDLASTASVPELVPPAVQRKSLKDLALDFMVSFFKRRLLGILLSIGACMIYLISFFDLSELVEVSQMMVRMEEAIKSSQEKLVVDVASADCPSGGADLTVEAVENIPISEHIASEAGTIQEDPSLHAIKEGLRKSSSASVLDNGNQISSIDSSASSTQPADSSSRVTGSLSSPSLLGTLKQEAPTFSEQPSTVLRAEAVPFVPTSGSGVLSGEEEMPSTIPVVSLTRRKSRARGSRTHAHAGRGKSSKKVTGSKLAIIGNF